MSSSIFQGPIKDQAKGHQLSFSVSTSSLCNPLDLIFSDVWGPSPPLSINGNRDYVSVIDTFSRFTWVFPIQSKSDGMPMFLKFQAMVARLLNSKIESVQIDWGGPGDEYRNLPIFNPLASSIAFYVLTRINNKDALKENTVGSSS